MAQNIQGPGGATPPQQAAPADATTHTEGRGFGRSISATTLPVQMPAGSAQGGTALRERSVSHPGIASVDILTSQGLKDIAGDPKQTLFKKSPTYTKLLNTLDHYQQLKRSSAPRQEKIAALQDIVSQAQAFSDKKVNEAKKAGGKLEQVLARIAGAEQLIKTANAEIAILTCKDWPPTLTKAELQQAIDQQAPSLEKVSAEHLHHRLATEPPKDMQTLLTTAHLYSDDSLLEEHFNQLFESKPQDPIARTLMLKTPDGSLLKKIAAESWAPGKVAREIPQLPTTRDELQKAEQKLTTKLKAQNVPAEGRDAALAHLRSASLQSWQEKESEEPIYQNIPKRTDSTSSLAALNHLNRTEAYSQQLTEALEHVPDTLKTGATPEEEKALETTYNDLHKPTFNANNNILHDPAFVTRAKLRYGAGRERDMLPCPTKSAVNTKGQPRYHANHVQMPFGNCIAAQGPIEKNQANYWEMLSEQQAAVSIDLTNPTDPSPAKRSYQYTPPAGETKTYDNGVTVTNHGESTVMGGRFTLQQLEVNGKMHTRIQHNKFDDKTPGNPADLVALSLLARNISPDPSVPVVVHCSAGIGRTGTLIAVMDQVDHARQGKTRDPIDAINTFRSARGPKGIQTPGQLHTIMQVHNNIHQLLQPMQA